jgi:hypothetical protein
MAPAIPVPLLLHKLFLILGVVFLSSTTERCVASANDDDVFEPSVQYWHNYNLNGKSAWANCTFSNFQQSNFIPGLPPQYTNVINSTNTSIVSQTIIWLPTDYNGDWHCNPHIQLNVIASGVGLWTSEDGVSIEFGPGSFYLGDDLNTGGHQSKTISDVPLVILTTQLERSVSDENNPCWL